MSKDNDYNDIINYERPLSRYAKMTMKKRAAQFMPFSALTGYGEMIEEEGHLAEKEDNYAFIEKNGKNL